MKVSVSRLDALKGIGQNCLRGLAPNADSS